MGDYKRTNTEMDEHPRIIQATAEGMKTLERLADASMKVGEAEGALAELKTQETEYLAEREGRAAAAVEKVLTDSEEVLAASLGNYEAANQIADTASNLSGRVKDVLLRVRGVMAAFDERSRLWESKVSATEARLDDAKKAGAAQKAALDAQRASLDKQSAELVDWERDLISREEALKRDAAELTPN